jgi:hypothetical protein
MTTSAALPIAGQYVKPKVFDDRRQVYDQGFPVTIGTTNIGLLDGQSFAEWYFDVVQHPHELVDVMDASSNG